MTAIRHTGTLPGAGGAAVLFPSPLTGGSGGAGGSGNFVVIGGNPIVSTGGFGGGAGGAVRIDTPGNIIINGTILANGAWGHDSSPAFNPRPGGGGSGGVIDLHAATATIGATGLLQALGGPGGGISSIQPSDPNFSSGADGGLGFVRIHAVVINQGGTVDGVLIIPEPSTFALAALGFALLALCRVRRA